ncbi:histidine kinase dimerization/phospho-acceptor domain-containing protein [Altererythrobacter sp. MTPC7]|uniref:sensor histidine kinase n=1 Tax=Altererythrobacter sp. MTPC7 TaxID=3056567 RepID=UPI0036F3E90D
MKIDTSGTPSPERMAEILQRKLARAEKALAEAERALEGRMRELDSANRELRKSEEELVRRLELQNQQLVSAQRTGGFATIHGGPREPFTSSVQLSHIFGYPPDRQMTPEDVVARIHPLDARRMMAETKRFYSELPPDIDYEFDHRIVHPETGTRWLRWHMRRSTGKGRTARGIYGSVRDITEIRQNERTVRMLQLRAERRVKELDRVTQDLEVERTRAEDALAVRTRFLSTMAHQFRTPLAALSGLIDLLDGRAEDEAQQRILHLAEHSLERIGALVEDALAEAQGGSDSTTLFDAPLSLARLFEQSRLFWDEAGDGQDYTISWEIARELPVRVIGDAVRLRELVDNLCGFAAGEGHDALLAAGWAGGLDLTLQSARIGYEVARGSDPALDPQFRRAVELARAMGGQAKVDGERL